MDHKEIGINVMNWSSEYRSMESPCQLGTEPSDFISQGLVYLLSVEL